MGDVNLYDTSQNLEDDGLDFLIKKDQPDKQSQESETLNQEHEQTEV